MVVWQAVLGGVKETLGTQTRQAELILMPGETPRLYTGISGSQRDPRGHEIPGNIEIRKTIFQA